MPKRHPWEQETGYPLKIEKIKARGRTVGDTSQVEEFLKVTRRLQKMDLAL